MGPHARSCVPARLPSFPAQWQGTSCRLRKGLGVPDNPPSLLLIKGKVIFIAGPAA